MAGTGTREAKTVRSADGTSAKPAGKDGKPRRGLDASEPETAEQKAAGALPYDFRRPNKVSRDHVRALQIVNETFARQFATILSTTLRAVTHVSLASIDHMSYDEYVRESPNPSFLTLFGLEPLVGAGIFQLPLPVAYGSIDRLLGGNGEGEQPGRALSDIETVLLRGVVERVLGELDYAFESLAKVEASVLSVESNPQFAQITAPSEMVMVSVFDIRIGTTEAEASMCLPLTMLLPVLEQMTGKAFFADRKSFDAEDTLRALTGQIEHVPVEVSVSFEPVVLTGGDILGLQPGDVLPLRHPVGAPLKVQVSDRTCAFGVAGAKGRRMAFMVVEDGPPPLGDDSERDLF